MKSDKKTEREHRSSTVEPMPGRFFRQADAVEVPMLGEYERRCVEVDNLSESKSLE